MGPVITQGQPPCWLNEKTQEGIVCHRAWPGASTEWRPQVGGALGWGGGLGWGGVLGWGGRVVQAGMTNTKPEEQTRRWIWVADGSVGLVPRGQPVLTQSGL